MSDPPCCRRAAQLVELGRHRLDHRSVRAAGPGMTALTGETGAGKTLVVEAIELLARRPGRPGDGAPRRRGGAWSRAGSCVARRGGRAGPGACPADGRQPRLRRRPHGHASARWPSVGAELVDLHGQHAHQSLLRRAVAARRARPLRRRRRVAGRCRDGPGGGARDRRRARGPRRRRPGPGPRDRPAALPGRRDRRAPGSTTPTRTRALDARGGALADAGRPPRARPRTVRALLDGDGGAVDALGAAVAALERPGAVRGRSTGRPAGRRRPSWPTWPPSCATAGERVDDDPERWPSVRERRQLLRELRRKYGDTLADVIAYAATGRRPARRAGADEERAGDARGVRRGRARAPAAEAAASTAPPSAAAAARRPGAGRRGAPARSSRMPRRCLGVEVGRGSRPTTADDVAFLLAANPGEPPRPAGQGRVGRRAGPRDAGGSRLVLGDGPADARVRRGRRRHRRRGRRRGRARAAALGARPPGAVRHPPARRWRPSPNPGWWRSPRSRGPRRPDGGRTVRRRRVGGEPRVTELSRMLAGIATVVRHARRHAEELPEPRRARPC